MKTFSDLTDNQLIEIHRLAHSISGDFIFNVERQSSNIKVSSADFMTMFKIRTGSIIPYYREQPDVLRNLWQIINLCVIHALDYCVGLGPSQAEIDACFNSTVELSPEQEAKVLAGIAKVVAQNQ